jgi:hypothetical protein
MGAGQIGSHCGPAVSAEICGPTGIAGRHIQGDNLDPTLAIALARADRTVQLPARFEAGRVRRGFARVAQKAKNLRDELNNELKLAAEASHRRT